MVGLANDVRRGLPLTGTVLVGWLSLLGLWGGAVWWATAPHGHFIPLAICELLVFAFAIVALLGVIWALLLFVSRNRGRAILFLMPSMAILATGPVIGPRVYQLRAQRFQEFAVRSRPLLAAIEDYHRRQGRPPETLKALVPEYLDAVPTTGMGAFPEYLYSAGESGSCPWRLAVSVGATPLAWESLVYWPSQCRPRGPSFDGWVLDVG
jgi:hypothetical protein